MRSARQLAAAPRAEHARITPAMALDMSLNHLARRLRAHDASSRALVRAAQILGMRPEALTAGGEQQIARRLRGLSVGTLGKLSEALGGASSGFGSVDAVVHAFIERPTDGSKLEEIERAIITHAVAVSDGNVSAAARLLGVERKMLDRRWRKIQRGQ
jgi:hypothetical protein